MGDSDDFPGLRFDPTPGIVPSIETLTDQVRAAGGHFDQLVGDLDRAGLDPNAWRGRAGSEFHTQVNELAPEVRTIKDALFNAQTALSGWSTLLGQYQSRRQQLEQQAVEARARVGRAEAAPGMSQKPHGFEAKDEYDRKKGAYNAAKSELDAAKDDLAHIISLAKGLQDEHHESAKSAAKQIESAMDRAEPDPTKLTSVPGTNPLDDALRISDLLTRDGGKLSAEDQAFVQSMLTRYANDPRFILRLSQETGTGALTRLAVDNAELRPIIDLLERQGGFSRYDLSLQYITDEMVQNGQGSDIKTINRLYGPSSTLEWALELPKIALGQGAEIGNLTADKAAALAKFAWLVRPGGDWDHKPKFAEAFGLTSQEQQWMPVPGHPDMKIYYDVWSNIHYGFVGRQGGIEQPVLMTGQNLPFTGKHDPGDDLTVQMGMDLRGSVKPGELTPQDVQAIIDANLAELIRTDKVRIVPPVAP